MRYKDKNTGIIFGVNYASIKNESQKRAVEGFVEDLKENLDCEEVVDENDF